VADEREPERREPPTGGAGDRDGPGRDGPDRDRPGRGRGPRVLLAALVATGLLGLVAVGSLRGPLGSGRGRPSYPADLVDSLVLLLFLAMLAAGVLALVALWPDRNLLLRPRRRSAGVVGLLLPLAAILVVWLFWDVLGLDGLTQQDPTTTTPVPSTSIGAPAEPPRRGVVPLVVAGVALLAMVAVVAAQLAADRRRRRPPRTPAERLVELLDDTLEDLEREPDPRRAVIAAWARMERGLAAAGLPREPAEAPFEYAARVLDSALVAAPAPVGGERSAAVHRLTGLFERAKFSRHHIGPADRDQAVAALRAVRRELAEAADQADRAAAAAAAAGPGGPGFGRREAGP
jgi:Domain of unknown function (DUF4129)